jgi:CDGSH-type Zn-finger protein
MADVTITPRDNGPYRIEGPVRVVDAEGNIIATAEGRPVFLCRCGQSATKPFCDGTHRLAEFESIVRATRVPVEA